MSKARVIVPQLYETLRNCMLRLLKCISDWMVIIYYQYLNDKIGEHYDFESYCEVLHI